MGTGVLVDVGGLRAAAGTLRGLTGTLEEEARVVAHGEDAVWTGLAALEQAARRAETASLLRALGGPVREVAAGLDRLALVAEDVQDRSRRHAQGIEDADHEHRLLLWTGPPGEPAAAVRWRCRVEELQQRRARLDELLALAQAELDAARTALADLVRQALGPELYALVGALALLHEGARRGVTAWRAGQVQITSVWAAHRLHRARPAGERTAHVVATRLDEAVHRLRGQTPGWAARLPVAGRAITAVASRGVPLLVLPSAVPRVVDGGGHGGLRGGTTRVLAGAAVVGVVAAVAAPGLVVAGAVAVSTYQVWLGGTWVYDNRQMLGRVAGRSWTAAGNGLARAVSAGRGLAARAAHRARSGVERLRLRWSGGTTEPSPAGVLP